MTCTIMNLPRNHPGAEPRATASGSRRARSLTVAARITFRGRFLALALIPVVLAGAAAPQASQPSTRPSQADLERRFAEALSGAVLRGTWQMTGPEGLAGRAPLGEPKPERYVISAAVKDVDDWWIIHARIQFADTDVTLPVRVRVVWAGDTPIITVDNVGFPGIGVYSARVMIYRDFYCGTWFGPDYGGVLSGQIVRDSGAGPPTSQPASAR